MYLNKTQIIGNLTRDPEQASLPSGVVVSKFSLATNRTFKNKEGEKQEEVEFHNVVAFGKVAEIIGQYCKKGKQIYVEGRLKTSTWEDKDTQKKMYRTEIIAENFQFGNSEKRENTTDSTEKDWKDMDKKDDEQIEYPKDDINPEDIPF